MRYKSLTEIAVLPCLPARMSPEDCCLGKSSPSFDLQHAIPNQALASALSFLNISKRRFFDLVQERRGINLCSAEPQGTGTGPFRHRSEYAADWRALTVAHDPNQPQLLSDDEFVEIMENASYGGQLAIAGYVDHDFILPKNLTTVRLLGHFQIGIIDYIWGSGHTVSFNGALTLDLSAGQIGDPPGTAFDEVCGFVVDYFYFSNITPGTLLPGQRFRAERTIPLARAA